MHTPRTVPVAEPLILSQTLFSQLAMPPYPPSLLSPPTEPFLFRNDGLPPGSIAISFEL